MKGMELARAYYSEYADRLCSGFPRYADRMVFGLAGEGSECYGYDDEFSQNHDFGPGFCVWITRETARAIGNDLQAVYFALPKTCQGYTRHETEEGLRHAEARDEDQLNGLLLGHGQGLLLGDDPALHRLLLDLLGVDTRTVVGHLDDDAAALLIGRDLQDSLLGLADGAPVLAPLDAVVQGVADQVHHEVAATTFLIVKG